MVRNTVIIFFGIIISIFLSYDYVSTELGQFSAGLTSLKCSLGKLSNSQFLHECYVVYSSHSIYGLQESTFFIVLKGFGQKCDLHSIVISLGHFSNALPTLHHLRSCLSVLSLLFLGLKVSRICNKIWTQQHTRHTKTQTY